MKIVEILKKIGLDEKESQVYGALLEIGPSTISGIAKRSGSHRPIIYKVLPHLQEKGLVTVSPKGKQKLYSAESPERLKNLIEDATREIGGLLPELEKTYHTRAFRPLVKFLEGKEGITFVFEDLVTNLKKDGVYYRYTSNKDFDKAGKYLPKNFTRLRERKQLNRYIITNEVIAKQKRYKLGRVVKAIPPNYGLFDHDITKIIYGKKVAFVDFNTETALIIENKVIAEFEKSIFKMLFDKL